MAERIPIGVAYLVVFRAYLASDGKTPATSKTIPITISKNGATSFSNPAAGATNATEMASGFYKFTLATGDTGTAGPLAWRGAEGTINDAGDVLTVANDAGRFWDEINTGATHNVTNSAGKQLRSLATGNDAVIYPPTGTVTLASATSTTATLDGGASAVSQAYQWNVINILAGTGAGQSRIITNYTTGRVATITPAWTTTPDATSEFDITPTASVQVVAYTTGQSPDVLVWAAATRTLTAGTNIVLAKGTGITGFNDIAATAIVSAGAINTSSGAVTTVTNLTNLPTAPTDWITAAALKADAVTEIAVAVRDIDNTSPASNSLGEAVNDAGGGGGGGDIVSVNGTTFAGPNVPCILADGVAHGGTPGSSTATFALRAFEIDRTAAATSLPAFWVKNNHPGAVAFLCNAGDGDDGTGVKFQGGHGLVIESTGGIFSALQISAADSGSAIQIVGSYTDPAPAIWISTASDPDGLAGGAGILITADGHGIDITANGTGKHGITSTGGDGGHGFLGVGGTDGDGFRGEGTGTGVGFNSAPDATGFGSGGGGLDAAGIRDALGMDDPNLDDQLATLSTFDASSDSVKLDLTQVIGATATLADALKAAYAQGAGVWDLNTGTKVLTLKNKDGTTFIQFDLDSVTAPTYRHLH